MDIPPELRTFMDLEHVEANLAIASMLTDETNKGKLINFVNLAEEEIEAYLSRKSSEGILIAKLPARSDFAIKIAKLKKTLLLVNPDITKHLIYFVYLDGLRRIRNLASHQTGPSPAQVDQLREATGISSLAIGFPDSGWSKTRELSNHLGKH